MSQSPPLSKVRQLGGITFISGIVARIDPAAPATATFEAQTKDVLQQLKDLLSKHGLHQGDVVNTRIYLTERANYSVMNELYRSVFMAPYPTRTTLIVKGLAGPGYLIEIDAIAGKVEINP